MINWALYLALIYLALRGAFQRPEWLLVAAAFFIPLTQALPFPVGAIGASANIIVGCLLIAWLRVRGQRPLQPPTPLRALILGMALFILLGLAHRYRLEVIQGGMFHNNIDEVYGEAKEWLMAYFAYFLVFRLVNSSETLRKMWWAGMTCAAMECGLAVYERLQGTGRATAHLDEPNRAGAYFAVAFVMFLAMALLHTGRLRKLALGALILAAGAVFATLSRGAILATGLGSLLVLLIFYTRVREGASKLGVAALILLAAINSSMLLPERVVDRIMFTFQGGSATSRELGLSDEVDQSSGERLAIWQTAIDIMLRNPTGIGFYTFPTALRKHLPLAKVAHNIYLTVGTELGIAALLWMVLLIGAVWWQCWVAFREAEGTDEKVMGLSLLGGWTALAVAVFFINPFFAFNLSGQFWVLFAACMKVRAVARREREQADQQRWQDARLGRDRRLSPSGQPELHGG